MGGAKDSLAPVFTGSNLDSTRVNVPTDLKELRLDFDEYITLKDVQRNLTISPPITLKKILPSMLGNRYILIQWEEPLLENTTYNFNFGNAISDLNENNVLSYFNFAFSTGPKLEETYISGEVVDGMLRPRLAEETPREQKKEYVVGLYQEKDSINYRSKPYYLSKADPDGYFELNYITPGTYRLLAFEDENQNSIYDPGKEKVAFLKDSLQLNESISGMPIVLYPAKKPFRYVESKESVGGLTLVFEGNPKQVQVEVLEDKIKEYKVVHKAYSDSVFVYFDAKAEGVGQSQSENIKMRYETEEKSAEASLFYREASANELALSNSSGALVTPNGTLEILSNYPLESLQSENWTLNKDSLSVIPFTAEISKTNAHRILLKAEMEPGQKYSLSVPRGGVRSYYVSNEKAYQFNFEIDREENYGTLVLELQNPPSGNYWLQFLSEVDQLQREFLTTGTSHRFEYLKPGVYQLRILSDDNGNGIWDAADFEKKEFAEKVYHFPKKIEIRPLWENRETWNLSSGSTETPIIDSIENRGGAVEVPKVDAAETPKPKES